MLVKLLRDWIFPGIEERLARLEQEVQGLMTRGIDVSLYQGKVDWNAVYTAGYRFAFVRASMGDERPPLLVDGLFRANAKDAGQAGLKVGAYHYAYPDYNEPESEARHFLTTARKYVGAQYLRPVLDLERRGNLDKRALSAWVIAWASVVENETGVKPLLYTSAYYAANYFDESVTVYPLWIADWTYDCIGTRPRTGVWDNWAFWQWSDRGRVPGIETLVDLNIGSTTFLQEVNK